MSDRTKIEWTDTTWNPVTGCSKISTGCDHCYAKRMARRLQAMHSPKYRDGFTPTCHAASLYEPDRWREPRMIFVCSMGDLFHEAIPEEFIQQVFSTMVRTPQHTYQVLTKRADRLRELAVSLPWPKHIWAGVSVEDDDSVHRVRALAAVPAHVRFVSLEPLLGPVPRLLECRDHGQGLLDRVEWVIVGGETGPGARRMPAHWPQQIRDECIERQIPFFFKRWGSYHKDKDRRLDGELWEQIPRRGNDAVHTKTLLQDVPCGR